MSFVKENPLVTDLVGEKTTKLDCRVAFFGECDELSCRLMELRCLIDDKDIKDELLVIVNKLMIVMAEIAGGRSSLVDDDLQWILDINKKYEENNGVVTEFVLPGQNLLSSRIHITRCAARKTELSYAKVYNEYKTSLVTFEYLNKLSTLLYNLALRFEK